MLAPIHNTFRYKSPALLYRFDCELRGVGVLSWLSSCLTSAQGGGGHCRPKTRLAIHQATQPRRQP